MARRLGWARLRKAPSRIAVRLLAFNVLLTFLPFAGLLYLDTYERHLLEAQERAMVDQARVLAGVAATVPTLDAASMDAISMAMGGHGDARLRIISIDGSVIGDSHRNGGGGQRAAARRASGTPARDTLIYRLGRSLYDGGRWMIALARPSRGTSARTKEPANWLSAPEVKAAFAGRYGSATRATPGGQRSVTLYSAVPVMRAGRPEAVVLVSQSTYRLLQALYDVRLRIFEIVLLSAVVAGLVSLLVSATIVRPLRVLRSEAAAVVARRGGIAKTFRGARRRDEIGELARALEDLTRRLEERVGFVESFAADLSHEFKNPLASIRAVADTLPLIEDAAERERFLEMLNRDVLRLERLLAGVSDLVHVGVQIEREPTARTDIVPVVRALVEAHRERVGRGITIELASVNEATVPARADHLEQVVDNLLDNAAGFSPASGVIHVSVERESGWNVLTVRDQGPGIPEAHRDRVFDRFFSYRPGQDQPRLRHTGLGLPIVRTIVEACGGTIRLDNAPGGGTCARVRLPNF